jgi:hypothetical protein
MSERLNSQDGERQGWDDLPDLYVRLQKDELGYPPRDWEQLKAEPTDNPSVLRVKSIPFYARGIAYDDKVSITTSVEGYYPVFDSVVKRSGYSTVRLRIKDQEDRENLIDFFTNSKALLEFDGKLVALAIPREKFEELSELIFAEKDRGRWDSEDGFLIIDEP